MTVDLDRALPIADAVLYEGHILYPYRPSARKNRVRWTFGGVHPRAYSDASGGVEACRMQVQCLVRDGGAARLSTRVRFLHLVHRQVVVGGAAVDSVVVAGGLHQTWDEAEERSLELEVALDRLLRGEVARLAIDFPGRFSREGLLGADGNVAAVLERTQERLLGEVEVLAELAAPGLARLTLAVTNETPLTDAETAERDVVMRRSLVSTHAILGVESGEFISLADPPADLAALARQCRHQGAWPVMVGEPGDTNLVLATPIILEDYAAVAPESETALFDSTEIDEILLLRVMTMTDEEKAEATAADPSFAAILLAAESMTEDDLMRMHGTTRSLRSIPEMA